MRIPEVPLIATPQTDDARRAVGFRWAAPEVGKRHKVGGSPDWLQEPQVPVCPACQNAMSFYGQLDSLGDAVKLAECGIIYVFVCHGCYTTQSVLQSG
jgi:hypothetical protein